jgi:hypothetical protein
MLLLMLPLLRWCWFATNPDRTLGGRVDCAPTPLLRLLAALLLLVLLLLVGSSSSTEKRTPKRLLRDLRRSDTPS